jgi:serine/threonine-protein kinase
MAPGSHDGPQPGQVLLGKYRVESLVGEGGMGIVVKAHHLELDEPVAIKVLLPELVDRPDVVQRFVREGRAAVKLKGEHVARVLDVGRFEGELAGAPYIVMEFLEGGDLSAVLAYQGAQAPAVAVDLMLQACEAIAEAHSLGIIHRDIKASNFFIVSPDGQTPVLKVLDFGIATEPKGTSDLTQTQSIIGTPSYMAPEQMRSSRTADARSDIWSLGVVLYELLECRRPFHSEIFGELCVKIAMEEPEPFVQPAVSPGLRAVVLRCLEKQLESRYQSVAELASALAPFASDPALARASVDYCTRMLARRTSRTAAGDPTPLPVTPRFTPVAFAPPAAPPPAMTAPAIHKTPTSHGELGKPPSVAGRRRRRLAVSIGVASVLIVAGVVTVSQLGGHDGDSNASATTAAPATAVPAPPQSDAPAPPVQGSAAPAETSEPAATSASATPPTPAEPASHPTKRPATKNPSAATKKSPAIAPVKKDSVQHAPDDMYSKRR